MRRPPTEGRLTFVFIDFMLLCDRTLQKKHHKNYTGRGVKSSDSDEMEEEEDDNEEKEEEDDDGRKDYDKVMKKTIN